MLKHNLESIAPGAFAMISVLHPFSYKLIQVDFIACKEILKHKDLCVTGPRSQTCVAHIRVITQLYSELSPV